MSILEKNWHLVEEMTERLKDLKPCKVILDPEKIADNYRERMDRYLNVSSSLRSINYQIAMDIIVYSRAEFELLKEKGNDFAHDIEATGKVFYER